MNLRLTLPLLFLLAFGTVYGQSPRLVSTSPNEGNRGGRLPVKISGDKTKFTQATNTQAYFTQGTSTIVYPYSTVVNSDTELGVDVYFPTNIPLGKYNVVTKDNYHGTMELRSYFILNQGRLIKVNPNTAETGEKLQVGISGSNTHFKQATTTTIYLRQGTNTIIYPNSALATDDLTIYGNFQIPAGAPIGFYDVHATNTFDGNMQLGRSFLVTKKPVGSITTVSPSSGARNAKLNVTISGSGTRFAQGTSTSVYFVQGSTTIMPTTNVVAQNNSLVKADLSIPSNAPLGQYTTVVSVPNVAVYTKPGSFTVVDPVTYPTNIRIEPDSAERDETTSLTLYATGAKFTKSFQASVSFNAGATIMSASGITIVNDTTITMSLSVSPFADLGLYDVTINHNHYPKAIKGKKALRVYQIVGRDNPAHVALKAFPNPTNHLVTIQGLDHRYSHLKLIDMDGKVRFERHLYNATRFDIDMNTYSPGVYVVEVVGKESTRSIRVVKE